MDKEIRPIIKLKLSRLDVILEILTLVGLIATIGIAIYFYGSLPDQIPVHFDFKGNPDRYSDKNSIFWESIICLVIYVFIKWLITIPHKFNYLSKITKDNALSEYRLATRILRILNLITVFTFLYITYSSIQVAIGDALKLNAWFVAIFLGSIFVSLGVGIYYSSKK